MGEIATAAAENLPACQVFVYGTLKPGERAFERFCAAYVVEMVAAIAPGRLYHLPLGYPALTLESGWVQGVLLTFATAAVLTPLDAFEEYYPDRLQDSEYQRLRQRIYGLDYTPLSEAWVYTMTKTRVDALGGQWLPQGFWSETGVA
jgi:gamma-glutamylcyclotransferase (GGCT)/AIG2-like uncharacterized protein YtfP